MALVPCLEQMKNNQKFKFRQLKSITSTAVIVQLKILLRKFLVLTKLSKG